jgi:hypothetical protein
MDRLTVAFIVLAPTVRALDIAAHDYDKAVRVPSISSRNRALTKSAESHD